MKVELSVSRTKNGVTCSRGQFSAVPVEVECGYDTPLYYLQGLAFALLPLNVPVKVGHLWYTVWIAPDQVEMGGE